MDKNDATQPSGAGFGAEADAECGSNQNAGLDALRVEASDPETHPQRLHELSTTYPAILPALASNPSLYPELRGWLASLGNPAIDEGLALGAARAAAADRPWADTPGAFGGTGASDAAPSTSPATTQPIPGAPVRTPIMQRANSVARPGPVAGRWAPGQGQSHGISTTDPAADLPPVYIPAGRPAGAPHPPPQPTAAEGGGISPFLILLIVLGVLGIALGGFLLGSRAGSAGAAAPATLEAHDASTVVPAPAPT